MDSALMQDEIFGPILPIVEVDNSDAGLKITNERSHPLAMYVFSTKRSEVDMILQRQTSGGVAVNECILHMVSPEMPFGGIGASGMGGYHGKFGLEELSHKRSVLRRTLPLDLALLKPPYKGKMGTLKRMIGAMLKLLY
jgi:aldehyde dehydrogenase (NAD+)